MCNCIKEVEEKLVKEGTYKGRKILSAEIQQKALLFNSPVSIKMYTEVEMLVVGLSKKQKQSLLYSHCPFCGIEYEKEK